MIEEVEIWKLKLKEVELKEIAKNSKNIIYFVSLIVYTYSLVLKQIYLKYMNIMGLIMYASFSHTLLNP